MNRLMNWHARFLGIGALIVGMALASDVQGAIVPTGETTIAEWQAAGTFEQQDKLWKIDSGTTVAGSTKIVFGLSNFNGVDYHTLQILGATGGVTGFSGVLNYTISIAPGFGTFWMTGAGLSTDPDSSQGIWSVKESLNNGSLPVTANPVGTHPLLVLNASQSQKNVAFLGQTVINVNEVFSFDSSSKMMSVTTTFVQSPIPEPATLTIWSLLGCFGAAFSWRRRRRVG